MDVSKAIPSKSPLPILENFLFVLKDGRLEITASDSELTLRTAIEVDGPQEEGSIAVSSPALVVDLTATAGILLLSMKLAVRVTSFEGIRKVVVGPRMLPMNSTPPAAVHVFRPWVELGGVAVMVTISPDLAVVLSAVPPLTVIL